jgi:hypothetical protein
MTGAMGPTRRRVQLAESMLMYGGQISDDDRDFREFFDVSPLTSEEALAQLRQATVTLRSASLAC